jgi:Kef-type K+ transport system membrane component KefB/Trk K+ transport system NAD-binding subunit
MADNSFYQLLLISALAFFVPIVAARVPGRMLPAVVGEIIAGIIIGTSGFDLIDPTPVLEFLANFGFAYLMFLSGLELDVALLTASGDASRGGARVAAGSPLGSGVLILAGTLAIAFSAVGLLEIGGLAPDLWLTTLILSTTSVGVVVPTLKEMGLATRPYGQSILVAAFVADFVTLLLVTAFAVIKREGPSAELALFLTLPLAFLVVHRLGTTLGRYRVVGRTMEELAHATAQLQVRGALALMLAFVVLAETIGSELILGSFIAGVILSTFSPEEGSSLRVKLDAIGYGFFIPIFFINVGADLDLGALSGSAEDLSLLPIFLAIAYVSKLAPSLLLRLRFSWREALAGGFLLSSRLSLIIAASIIGMELGIITEGANSAIVLVAVATSSLSPIIFSRLMQVPSRQVGAVIIVGAGETGRSLAHRLVAQGSQVVLIEVDGDAAEQARRDGFRVVHGRGDARSSLREAGGDSAIALVAVTHDDAYNLRVCRRARDSFGVSQLTARVSDPANREAFVKAGIRAVSVPLSTSAALENAVLRPNLFQLLIDRPKEYDVVEIALLNRALVGRRLREIRLPGNCLLLLIRHEGELVVPRGSTVLQKGDNITIAGDPDSVREAAQLLGGVSPERVPGVS